MTRFFSIRWRLVLSYVLLTVLTVSVVGALALVLMRSNLAQREAELLTINARAVARQAAGFLLPIADRYGLQQLADTAAFLGNTQVRIFDAQGNLIVDSGPRSAAERLMWIAPSRRTSQADDPGPQPWVVFGVLSRRATFSDFEARLLEELGLSRALPSPRMLVIERMPSAYGSLFHFSELRQPTQPASQSAPAQEELPPTSATRVQMPILAGDATIGFVELSGTTGFNDTALATAQRAFGLAALGAMAIAALAGLWVSQGLTAPLRHLATIAGRMAQGDLSARAPMPKRPARDEIERLAGQFNAMAEKLEASFAELSAERDALRRFIADASHELRTPITALKMANELLQGPAGDDPATRAEFLAQNDAQLRRLEWITHNLLDLSRLDAGIAQLSLADHVSGDILASAAQPFKSRAEQRGIQLIIHPSSFVIRCDRARIEIALSNLVDNALKFTPGGGRVEVSAESDDRKIRLLVRDTGIGVAEKDKARIFDRFYRGDNHCADGSGLGLAIVKSIAQAHGGRAFVESAPGQGSTFGIELPAVRESCE